MAKFRKKPVVVEAVQWTGFNLNEVKVLGGDKVIVGPEHPPIVKTANGLVGLSRHAWLVRDPTSGDTWPVDYRIFEQTYELVEE